MWMQIRKVVEETKKQQRRASGQYRQNPALKNHSDPLVCKLKLRFPRSMPIFDQSQIKLSEV